jgi:hypothetical protein
MVTWSPISGVMSQYDKSAAAGSGPASGYYLKFYDITNTAISMASASDGSGLLLKAQLDSSGYPVNGSDARFIPFIDQNYRPALYTNVTDADANTIANADWFPGTTPQLVTGSNQAENVLSRDTLNAAVIDTSLQAGLSINIKERTTGNGGGAMWDVVLSSTVTENALNIVQCTGVGTLSLVQRELAKPYGAATVAELKATDLIPGQKAITTGYYDGWASSLEPKGGATYAIAVLADVTASRDVDWVLDEYVDHTLDNGYIAVLEVENELNALQAGAKWDESTDDSLAMQAWATYIGTINCAGRFPQGTGRFTGIILNARMQGMTMRGSGRQRTFRGLGCTVLENNGTTPMFIMDGQYGTITGLTQSDFTFRQVDATSGGFFESILGNSVSEWSLERFDWGMENPAAKLININAASYATCRMRDHYGSRPATHSVSAYYIRAAQPGSYFNNVFENMWINNPTSGAGVATAPAMSIYDDSGGATNGCNSFEDITVEHIAEGGFLYAEGMRHSTFKNIFGDDSGTPTAHGIHLAQSAVAGAQDSSFNTFIDCISRDGDTTWKDIYNEHSASGSQTVLLNCRFSAVDIEGGSYTSIGTNINNDLSANQPIRLFSGTLINPSGNVNPDIEHGKSAAISGGANLAIVFTNTFLVAPNVIASHSATTAKDGVLTVGNVTVTGCTIYNNATTSTQAFWSAMA